LIESDFLFDKGQLILDEHEAVILILKTSNETFVREGPSRLWLRSLPERAGLSKLYKRGDHFPDILPTMGNPIRVQAPAKIDTREEFDKVWKCKDTL